VRAEGHGIYPRRMSLERSQGPARFCPPEPGRPIAAASEHDLAVGAEHRGENPILMPGELAELLSGRRVPQAHQAVLAGREDAVSVRMEGDGMDLVRMPERGQITAKRCQVPQPG